MVTTDNDSLSKLVKPGVSKRSDFTLIPSKAALIVIDIQDYLSSPVTSAETDASNNGNSNNSYLFATSLPKAIPNIVQLVDTFRHIRDLDDSSHSDPSSDQNHEGCEVLFTFLQSSTPDGRDISLDYKLSGPKLTNIPSTKRKETFDSLPKSLSPNPSLGKGDILIPKTSCSVFTSTNINYILSNLNTEQIVICGQLTDQCVLSAVRDAADLGYFVTVVEDACAALSLDDHKRGLLGIQGFARVITTKSVVNEVKLRFPKIKSQTEEKHRCKEGAVTIDNDDIHNNNARTKQSTLTIIDTKSCNISSSKMKIHNPAIEPLLYALEYANVKFLRYASIDIANSIRTKAVPIQRLIKTANDHTIDNKVSIAKVCMAGLPHYADAMMSEETGLDARDVLVMNPDVQSLRILPYSSSSAMVFGTLHDQRSGELSDLCTRGLLYRVIETAKEKFGLGFGVGAEIEFILLSNSNSSTSDIKAVDNTVFASTTTLNEQDDFINDVYDSLQKQKIEIELLHSESAPGQIEIVLPYQNNVMKIADHIVLARETIKVCAKKHNLHAIFLPKVFDSQAGNGMHVHLSLTSSDESPSRNLFSDPDSNDDDKLLSDEGEAFLEGILRHLKALLSLTMPTVNSYRRVGPGCWTGHSVCWMVEEKESPLRVCLDLESGEATNVEFKLIDSTCNIYLALAGILFAGLDGLHQHMKLRSPEISGDDSDRLPQSIEESLQCLSDDTLLCSLLGKSLTKSYIAVKKAESNYSASRSLSDEVDDAMKR